MKTNHQWVVELASPILSVEERCGIIEQIRHEQHEATMRIVYFNGFEQEILFESTQQSGNAEGKED